MAELVRPILRRSSEQGFLGAMPVDDQIEHALGFRAAIESVLGRPPTSLVDLGSGGGVPGLVLAGVWEGTAVVLLDASERRTNFLREEVTRWGRQEQIEVVRGRAEEIARSRSSEVLVEVVTARSFGPPAVTAECAAPMLEIGGFLVVSEPPQDDAVRRWDVTGLSTLGLGLSSTFRFAGRFGYQLIRKLTETPDRYPRRVGIPAKRPLF
jgi:16S rRNA (guanine527-N7)-methyltransferase